MIRYIRKMNVGNVYFELQENTKQVCLFEYVERIDKETFAFEILPKRERFTMKINEMKRRLTEYNGNVADILERDCLNCIHLEETERRNRKRKIYHCKHNGSDIYTAEKWACFGYCEKP